MYFSDVERGASLSRRPPNCVSESPSQITGWRTAEPRRNRLPRSASPVYVKASSSPLTSAVLQAVLSSPSAASLALRDSDCPSAVRAPLPPTGSESPQRSLFGVGQEGWPVIKSEGCTYKSSSATDSLFSLTHHSPHLPLHLLMSPQIYFITGTSSGFGLHLTELALAQGDIVIATLRTPSALDDLVARHGTDRLLVLPLDITKPEQRVAALEAAKSRFGRIDVFINNAGQVGPVGELEGVPSELARSLFGTWANLAVSNQIAQELTMSPDGTDINFWATLDMTSIEVAFLRDVNKPQGGRIFNISSFVGYSSYPGCGIYNASKHGGWSPTLPVATKNVALTVISSRALQLSSR